MGVEVVLNQPLLSGRFDLTARADRFERLVQDLKDALGPSSGLTSEDVDVEHLKHLMEEYASSEREWSKYAFGDTSRGYTRNLVDEGNGKSNLVSQSATPASSASNPMRPVPGDYTKDAFMRWGTDPLNSWSWFGAPAREAQSTTMETPTA